MQNGDFQTSTNGSSRPLVELRLDGLRRQLGAARRRVGRGRPAAIPVEAGRTYELFVDVLGSGGAVVQQLSALGGVLASAPLGATLTPLAGVTQVRIVLRGGLVGATTFDNVWMGEI